MWSDRKGTLLALNRCTDESQAVQSILANGEYVGQPFALAVEELLDTQL